MSQVSGGQIGNVELSLRWAPWPDAHALTPRGGRATAFEVTFEVRSHTRSFAHHLLASHR
jgi:hypothetical protein